MIIKGVVLAGGLGSRLYPLTKITNKHLLPVGRCPMIYHPIYTLANAGVKDVMVVTGGNNAGDFLRLLGNGREFGLRSLNYAYQKGEGGIAEALGLTQNFVDGDRVVVVLGDNIIEGNILKSAESFKKQRRGARVLLKEVPDPERFGVAELDGDKIVSIEEKPEEPKTNCVVTGIYMYDARVFDIIKTIKPSDRGELEITDVNNAYIKMGAMEYDFLEGWWTDAGTFPSLLLANTLVSKTGANKMSLELSGVGRI